MIAYQPFNKSYEYTSQIFYVNQLNSMKSSKTYETTYFNK